MELGDLMSDYFTLDRVGQLDQGLILLLDKWDDIEPPTLQSHLNELSPEGVSRHGERHFVSSAVHAMQVDSNIELIFEYVRRSSFGDRPSRFQVVFGGRSRDEIVAFANEFASGVGRIWQISGHEGFRADMRYLTLGGTPLEISFAAHQYWRGAMSDDPLPESLLVPPVNAVAAV
jgi:hypothetical protein